MIALDKQAHALSGAVILFTFATFGYPLIGLIAACVAGVGKEIYDYCHPFEHDAEIADALFTVAGALIAFGVVWVSQKVFV
jgi:hypothetical protein